MKLLTIAVCLACAAGAAHAGPADQLFRKGKRLLAEKRYAEACDAFTKSDGLEPGIGAKLNVAKCYQEWGRLATAWRWFGDAERMARAASDDRAPKIHALIEELDGDVPRLTVKAPAGADLATITITLDGAPLAISELGVERRVDPGPHQIDYVVAGEKLRKTVPVEPGGSSEVLLELPAQRGAAPAAPVVTAPAAAPQVAREADPGHTHRVVGRGVAAAGVVAIGVAGFVTLGARGDYHDALTEHCRGATDMCDAAGLTATRDARHTANVATVVTIGGAVAVAGGLALYFFAPRASRTEHAMYVAPAIGGAGNGVVFGGAF